MQTETTPAGRASDWPYAPAAVATWTGFNLTQERDYLTARAALGYDREEMAEAIANVRDEIERRKAQAA